jgi:hypothetical protein
VDYNKVYKVSRVIFFMPITKVLVDRLSWRPDVTPPARYKLPECCPSVGFMPTGEEIRSALLNACRRSAE